MKICAIDGCSNKYRSKGYCELHYQRFLRHKDPNKKLILYKDYSVCTVDKCQNKHLSKGYCRKHYRSILKPEKVRESSRTRRARKFNNYHEKYSEKQVIELYGTKCYICSKEIDMSATRRCGKPGWEKGLHIEHVVDIALGGPDILSNVRPSHGICNLTKKPREMV